MSTFYKIFDSDDPEEPTFEDEFKMDLAAILNYKSVAEMLDTLDELEYQFWLQKYRRSIFGPSMENHGLALIAYVCANAFSKTNLSFDKFVYKVFKSVQERMNEATERRYFENLYKSNIDKGMEPAEAKELAREKATIYITNLKKRQAENASD